MTKRAAIYCRVSRDEQADNWSLPTQEPACRKYAEERGFEIVGVWREDYTGTQIDRPDMNQIMKLVTARKVDVVLCYKIDRLSRGGANHVGYFLTVFQMHGATCETVLDPIDDTPEGQMMTAFRAGAANKEVLEITERTRRGLRAKAQSGKPLGGAKAPFGLRYKAPEIDSDGRPIKGTVNAAYEPDPLTIDTLRWMFTSYDNGGSLRKIARDLGERGVPTPNASRTGVTVWQIASVRMILSNRCYIGEGVQFRTRVEKHPDPSKGIKRFQRPIDPTGSGAIPLPVGVFPVVIDPDQFERVQDRFAQNRRESQRSDRNPEVGILRRGIARCAHCGSALTVAFKKTTPVYTCQEIQRQRHGCPAASIRVDMLDTQIWDWMKRLRDDPRLARTFAERAAQGEDATDAAQTLVGLNGRLDEIDRQRAKLTKRLALVDDDTAELVATELRRLADQRKIAVMSREKLQPKVESEDRRQRRIERAVEIVAGIGEEVRELDELGYHERRRLLQDLAVTVRLNPTSQKQRWSMSMFTNHGSKRAQVVGNPDISVVWDENDDPDEMTFYLSSQPG